MTVFVQDVVAKQGRYREGFGAKEHFFFILFYLPVSMSEEELEEFRQEKEKNQTEEENAIMKALHESLPKDV